MNYREALAWLFGTQLFGIKLGLENVERLLGALEVPAPEQQIIHVAGTNGKGSVCAMIDSIARAARLRSGLFTSPHLVTFRERIQVNGELIAHDEVALGLTTIRDLIAAWDPHPTFFEITTALALWHFKRAGCELIVLETGMGGRLDATNAVTPVVAVLTPVDYDHQKWLGSTLTEIAAEKAGIIKREIPVVSAVQKPEAEKVITERARACASPLEIVRRGDDSHALALQGAHQCQNAALAQAALRAAGITLDEAAIAHGLADVVWPARFQRIGDDVVIDGAHNPAGARVLVETWRNTFGAAKATIIAAVLCDKDAAAIVRELAPIAARFILPPARTERALPPNEFAEIIRTAAIGIDVTIAASLEDALAQAAPPTLLTGSLHFAGEVLAHLNGNPDELEDCAQ
ncbi:MAG: bifunctional folylpolyglutamate synthase/dihydrofolate synthase [Verrucomicrobiota bacterium]|nr:bifunctional folylpolyglutamate synthase/dihydrofolate synthase [Verrucomicrobiota bacterium]